MIVDANLLIYAFDRGSPHHDRAVTWLEAQLTGSARVGLPWASLLAFLRISTHPAILGAPLAPAAAMRVVSDLLDAPAAWIPQPTPRHAEVLADLVARHHVTGDLVPDADLAALAVQHGAIVCSADTDFARFTDVRWHNPLD